MASSTRPGYLCRPVAARGKRRGCRWCFRRPGLRRNSRGTKHGDHAYGSSGERGTSAVQTVTRAACFLVVPPPLVLTVSADHRSFPSARSVTHGSPIPDQSSSRSTSRRIIDFEPSVSRTHLPRRIYQLAPANTARPKPTKYRADGSGIMPRRSPLASGTPIARRIHKRPLRAGSATTADVALRRDCSQQALQRDHDVAGTQSRSSGEAGGAERVFLGQQLYQHVHGAPA